jgi:biopolymer transport protein TolR
VRTHNHRSDRRLVAEINVTPFVDVLLVVLVIVLLAVTVDPAGFGIQLPGTAHLPQPEASEPLKVTLDAAGGLTVDGLPASDAELEQQGRGRQVVLFADKSLTYEKVVGLIDHLAGWGVAGVTLGTLPQPPGP